ncbi:hypothetical protein EN808_27705 [Mesorhizobium sp. M8A.F.Ca.ET.165.01.1.1]|nr:hypothetical protein EOA36_34130 [Mesorhizobium sp. M8A.F.Ca.ET.021.01.1.1]RVD56223.1 hypothetical protein EN746_05030 [Mesorhizobium sp. M8A.F.Ca.ET.023.02.2.1]RWC74187.1 MAG: hypothetical protein EOS30_13200 [Mesorhizobium sp.]TGS37708.1 hypothetical protein EN825_30495 [Mesorhizobium sp. M8A.F.Ca.ET.182.01.1.1]TGS76623.1 hypothetical protein EN824_29850 [Mesorhizobium sp. M8A.F.Ca.ET.181.01.1.1]TGT36444.1 hypothetical protein EN808_27705 [Mesorhizobium sp. M8A.F.Ca.ET.165.01.1.1]TGV0952
MGALAGRLGQRDFPRKFRESINHFVIHGRSKERSDAAQTRGSMPRLQGGYVGAESCPAAPGRRSRNGSQGLRDGATLLLRPGMTKF